MSALGRKSWRDLRRRRARSAFTVATIAAAVTGLWIFAMPTLMDRAMENRIEEDNLYDARLSTTDVVLDDTQLDELRAVPGVAFLDVRTLLDTRIFRGDRRDDVLLVGVRDFDDQNVNVVLVDEGTVPGEAGALTDRMNSRSGRFSGGIGDRIHVADTTGELHSLTVSGRGDTLVFSQVVPEDSAVLYLPLETVNDLAGASGYNSIEFTVRDPERAHEVADAVRDRLLALEPGVTFTDLADVREAGTWPGQEVFANFSSLLYLGAILALISALVLISNTMTTMVAEQVREIAIMKAIGGRRRQIRRSFLRSTAFLGVSGTLVGIVVGIPFCNLALGFIGNRFLGIEPEWGVPAPVVIVSLVVGVGGTMLAALPALRRAARTSVRAGFESGVTVGPRSRLDRALSRVQMPRTAQIGLRNVTRRRTRTFATTLQISLAVGVAIGFLALGLTIADVTAQVWDTMEWDMIVSQRATVELDADAQRVIETTDGVATAHPLLYNTLEVDGAQYESWGMPPDSTLYSPDMQAGRWLDPGDEESRARVVVIGPALANKTGAQVGDTLAVGTALGRADLEVIGVDSNLMNNGTTLYLPLATFQELLGRSDTNAAWVATADQDERTIDRVAASVEDRLTAAGYPVGTEIHYVERAANLDGNRVIVGILAVMGIPIVLIGMIGLLNTMTMNVIERSRDIGILRCIGARARDVRRIFRTEALTVAFAGSLIALPLGWVIGAALSWAVTELFDFGAVPYSFSLLSGALAIVATVGLAWVVVIAPLRRASRLEPGNALRYE